MTTTKTNQIRVVEHDPNNEYYINAKLVKDYNKTDASETVAWNGTLKLYEGNGNYYLWSHSGNSSHKGFAMRVPDSLKDKIIDMAPEEAEKSIFA